MTNTYAGDPVGGLVLMEFVGRGKTVTAAHGREYRGEGDSVAYSTAEVHPDDVQILIDSGLWRKSLITRPMPIPQPKYVAETYIPHDPDQPSNKRVQSVRPKDKKETQ